MYTCFIITQYIGIIILMLEASYVICHKPARQQQTLLLLVLSLGINFAGCLLELQAQTMEEALMALKFSYLGKPFTPLCQFLFVMQACKIQVPKRIAVGLAGFHTVIAFLAFNCERHTLFYSSIRFEKNGFFPHLVLEHGPVYNLNSMIMILYVIIMVAVCCSHYRKSKKESEKKQSGYLILMNLIAVAGFLIYLSDVTKGYDVMLVAYLADTLLLSVLIFKGGILDTLTLAKELAVDELCAGLVVVDNDENIIYFNRKAEQIYEGITPGRAEAILEDLDDCILEEKTIQRDSSIYSASSYLIEQKNVYYGRMYVLSDITDSYHYTLHVQEQAQIMKELKEQAESANQAKSVFLSNMSHEIRTPMNAIVGLTEVLLRREWTPDVKRYLMNIKSSGSALLKLINDLLDFSKIEAGKFEIAQDTYDIVQMLRDIQVIGQTRIGDRNLRLVLDIDEQIPRLLYGDGLRIRQVIINIMNNAIKFTEKGNVTIQVKQKKREDSRMQLYVSVADTGEGIRKQDLNRLFDAFTQVDIKKNQGKEGTGLGLAICRQLVELMGGELSVTSEYGTGSDFFFTIWQGIKSEDTIGSFAQAKDRPDIEEENVFTFTAPQAKVLLADDNEINQEVAKALMEPFQMQIDVAANGKEALELICENHYDLVFMDHYMPVMDGVEAVEKIRAHKEDYFKKLPVIALTADAVQGVREELIAAGMNDFVSKPIDMKETARVLLRWLDDEKICR